MCYTQRKYDYWEKSQEKNMANLLLETETEQSLEARVVHVGERAISFEHFLDMAEEWLLREPRPNVRTTLNALFAS
jgi:hypothetical protein